MREQKRKSSGIHSALFRRAILFIASVLGLLSTTFAQQPKDKAATAPSTPPALVRTTTRHEVRRFGYGGTLTVYGAPEGSLTIEAWPRNEVDLIADIELRANTEEELAQLATVNNFLLDEDANHLTIITTGTHDRRFMRRAKNFPKKLLAMPWKIDYRLRVPAATDLEIYTGRGPLNLTGVEGAIRLNAGESTANLTLSSGSINATVGSGSVLLRIPARSWRGQGADIRLVSGDLTLELLANFNADIKADVLRTGRIENTYAGLMPLERTTPTETSLRARAGAGGATLSFVVGDGTLRIKTVTGDK